MRDSRKTYLKQVARRLRCPRQEREHLLAGLKEELADLPADLTQAKLIMRLGTPSALAAELESAVSPEMIDRCVRKRRLLTVLGFVLCTAVIVWLIHELVWVVSMFNGYTYDEIITWN